MNISRSNRESGFTLIEIMVVVIIVAIMGSLLVFGFDQALNRRKGVATEKLFKWLHHAADTATFRSSVIGLTQKENQLILLAFYRDGWYRLADHEPLGINEEIDIEWSDSLVKYRTSQARDFDSENRGYQSPYIVMLPSGEVFPDGEINVVERKEGQGRESQLSEPKVLATINWDLQNEFQLNWHSGQ